MLDMGEPGIVDLARDLIRLAGHTEDEISIVFSGLRLGEKLYEELLADRDTALPTPHKRLRVARLRDDDGGSGAVTRGWLVRAEAADASSDSQARELLPLLVPEFQDVAVLRPVTVN